MWCVDIYSEGDIGHDNYLQVLMPDSDFCDEFGMREKFLNYIDIDDRKGILNAVIRRASAELEILNKYDECLICCKCWNQVLRRYEETKS